MATVNLEGQPSPVADETADSLVASASEFVNLPFNESGNGASRCILPSASCVVSKGSANGINEKGDLSEKMTPSTAEVILDQSEAPVHVETTVEVCVKMVVCRKILTKTVNSKTGKVLSSAVRNEEDPPTVMNVHTYTSSTNTAQSSSTICPVTILPFPTSSGPTPIVAKRRPGRPRKFPPPLVPAPHLRTPEKQHPDSVKKDTSSESAETPELTSMEGENAPETKSEDAAESNTKAEHKLTILNRNQVSADSSPQREKQGVVAARVPIKRRRGRPSRVIKKPRKYLDSYVEEYVKSGSPEPSENDNNEENSEEEDMEGKDKEEGEEERQGEEEGEESKGETTEGAGESGGEQRTECAKCGKRFSNVSNCQRHINKDQCGRQHHCPFCETPFDTRALLDSHIESHRDEHNQNSYRCGDCNRAYITRNGYLKHKRMGTCYKRDVFHEDGTKGDFECPLCHVRFTTEKLLALHTEKVHENPNNEYKCPDCSRVFYSKVGFNKHIARKSCTQPHVCKVCGKKYSNKAKESFKSHMRYHLAETSGVQFQCEDCGRVYMTDMALRKHRLTSHTNKRPYKCSTCSKTFPMRYMVRDHERSHTGEKPFLCSLCGTSFSNRGHLYRHMRSHSLGTLHKRGRPRKYPAVSRPVLLKLKDAATAEEEVFEELGEREEETAGGELGVVEIKTDPIPQDVVQDLGSLGSGPTYITVHTIDGQLTDPTATQNIIGEGQLQHVVMETPDGMSDNMVLQVIRDLTGATTVYQHISAEQPLVASADSVVQAHPPQIVMSNMPPAQPGCDHPASVVVVEPGVSADSTDLQAGVAGGQQLLHSHGQPHPLMGAPPHTPLTLHT